MKLQVKPIHGWGWHDAKGAIDVPSPFELEADIVENEQSLLVAFGYFKEESHSLSGHWILLQQRTASQGADKTIDCNLGVYRQKPIFSKMGYSDTESAIITGFATIEK